MNKCILSFLLILTMADCNQPSGKKTADEASATETLGIQDYGGTGKITQGISNN